MSRKTTIIVAGVLVVLLFVAVLLKSWLAPTPAFNDADLQPNRAIVSTDMNAFPLLLEAGELMAISEQDETAIYALGSGSSWNEADAKAFLTANTAALAKLHEIWSRPQLQVNVISNFAQEYPYLEKWRQLTSLALIEARLSFHTGNEPDAFELAMRIVRFGHRVEASNGDVIHYLVGAAIKSSGLECLRQFANHTRQPKDSLLSIARQLRDFEANQDGLYNALKVDYATQATFLGEFSTDTNSFGQLVAIVPNPMFSATRSKVELAGQIRCTMIAVTNFYANGLLEMPVIKTNRSTLGQLLQGNAVGSMFNEMSQSSREKLLLRKCRENVALRATRVMLALRAFQMTHGQLPQSLAELLPDFLETIPLDDFDGKPIRYLPELKTIYSVGSDLTDNGGAPPAKQSKQGDLVFKFNFDPHD
jgi:hypothetical protein